MHGTLTHVASNDTKWDRMLTGTFAMLSNHFWVPQMAKLPSLLGNPRHILSGPGKRNLNFDSQLMQHEWRFA